MNFIIMNTFEIYREIIKMPRAKRILIIEKTIKSIRSKEKKRKLKYAAEMLLDEYKNNSELTVFTALDFEDFYETR